MASPRPLCLSIAGHAISHNRILSPSCLSGELLTYPHWWLGCGWSFQKSPFPVVLVLHAPASDRSGSIDNAILRIEDQSASSASASSQPPLPAPACPALFPEHNRLQQTWVSAQQL